MILSTNDIAEKLFVDRFFAKKSKKAKISEITDKAILSLLEDKIARPRGEICDILYIPWSSAYDALNRLINSRLIGKFKFKREGKRGRSQVLYVIPCKSIQDLVICECGFKMIEFDHEFVCHKCKNVVKK